MKNEQSEAMEMRSFLRDFIIEGTKIQIGQYNTVLAEIYNEGDLDKAEEVARTTKDNLYFLPGVKPETRGRGGDEDILKKGHLFFDFDIRKAGGEISDEEIVHYSDVITESLSGHKILSKWRYVVFSGNGIHVYYLFDSCEIGKEVYRAGMQVMGRKISEVVGEGVDMACVNIARISRLPGTVNMKTGQVCKVIKVQDYRLVSSGFINVGERAIAADEVQHEVVAYEDKGKYAKINEIPISGLVSDHFGWEFKGRNFVKDGGKEVACFVPEGENFLVHGGTEHLPDNQKGYSSFSFIKTVKGLENKGVFDWFASRYPQVKDAQGGSVGGGRIFPLGDLQKKTEKMLDEDTAPFTWGVSDLDEVFPPLERGQYVVIAGETGVGKTVYSLHMAMENCLLGLRVLYMSLEMSNEGLLLRYARDRAGIGFKEWKTKSFSDEKRKVFKQVLSGIPHTLLALGGGHVYNVGMLRNILEKERLDLVFIDNLGFFEGEGDTEVVKQASMSRGILDLVREFKDVTVVVIHHYRKGVKKEPRSLNDLMGSAKLSHDVSYALQVWRDVEKDDGITKILIQKNRPWGGFFCREIAYKQGVFLSLFDAKVEGLRDNDVKNVFG